MAVSREVASYQGQQEIVEAINGFTLSGVAQKAVWFDSVSSMQRADIPAGATAATRGYTTVNDGGNAFYYIREKTVSDVEDGGSIIFLDNENVAELITDGTVNVKQFGAKGDNTADDTTAFANVFAFAASKLFEKGSAFTDHTPSQYIGGIEVFIPNGIYLINDTIDVPSGCIVNGESVDGVFLLFDADYGLSLDGALFNNGKLVKNVTISNLSINMQGAGVAITNAEKSTADNKNNIQDCCFSNIQLVNGEVGLLIQGLWNCTFEKVSIQVFQFGAILDVNAYSGGNNNNYFNNLVINNITECGLYYIGQGSIFDDLDIEGVGTAWQGEYEGVTKTYNGVTYTVDKPCAVYLSKGSFATFNSPWFEVISNVDDIPAVAFYIKGTTGYINCRIKIKDAFFNTDVYHPIFVSSSCFLQVDNPKWWQIHNYFAEFDFSVVGGKYIFENIAIELAESIHTPNKALYNEFELRNVMSYGSGGVYNHYFNGSIATYSFAKEAFVSGLGDSYNYAYNKSIDTSRLCVNAVYKGNEVRRDYYNRGAFGLPRQCGSIDVSNGDTSATISTHFGNLTGISLLLTATTSSAASVIKDGYYISTNFNNQTITVTFLTAFTSNETINYFVMTA